MKIVKIALFLLFPLIVSAEIFTWIDQNGVVHYGSKKEGNALPAKLPEITKTKYTVSKSLSKSCTKHSGIDCSKGADTDGSVICTDGFTDAAARFIFSCNATKLSLENISELDPSSGNYLVYIRNKGGVVAKQIIVNYQFDNIKLQLEGPSRIEPYQIAEYQLPGINFIDQTLPKTSKIKLECLNCR